MSSLIYLNAFFCISFYYNNNNYPTIYALCVHVVVCRDIKMRCQRRIQRVCHLMVHKHILSAFTMAISVLQIRNRDEMG